MLGDGAQLLGPTAAGSGRVTIAGNAVSVPAGAIVNATGRTGLDGTLSGAGDLRVASGSLAVDSAMMDGSGTTTVASGASMTVRNADFYGLYLSGSRSLVNNGTVTLVEEVGTPFQSLLLNDVGTSVTNNGILDLQAGADIIGSGPLHVPVGGVLRSSTAGADSTVDGRRRPGGPDRAHGRDPDRQQPHGPGGRGHQWGGLHRRRLAAPGHGERRRGLEDLHRERRRRRCGARSRGPASSGLVR